MTEPVDPRWPKVLSLAVHEFRTPITVVAGYLRMLLKDRAGPVTDQQRRLLEEAEKSCGRLSALVAEMSELSALESGKATFNRNAVDLRAVLRDVVDSAVQTPDRELAVNLATGEGPATIEGDPVRLKSAFGSLLHGLKRELIDSDTFVVRETPRDVDGRRVSWIVFGSASQAEQLGAATMAALTTFDEWRGGCGLSLGVARRIIAAHGGSVWSPADGAKAAAVVSLPLA